MILILNYPLKQRQTSNMAAPRLRAEWEEYHQIIADMYRRGNTQADIQKRLETEYGFIVNVKQIEYRLKAWGVRKNITKAEYRFIGDAVKKRSYEDGKETDIYLNDVPVSKKKLKRNIPRYQGKTPQSASPGPSTVPVNDIAIVTPPGSPTPNAGFDGRPGSAAVELCRVDSSPPTPPNIREGLSSPEIQLVQAVQEKTETYMDTEHDARSRISISFRVKTPLFYAICRSIRYMISSWGDSERYQEALSSSIVENLLFNITASESIPSLQISNKESPEAPSSPWILDQDPPAVSESSKFVGSKPATTYTYTARDADSPDARGQTQPQVARSEYISMSPASASEADLENPHQLLRTHKNSDLRSLNGKYACPFAKGDPDNNVPCWTINRQNLSGIK
ncbi:hypothetical protein ABW21_db0205361 [Orbilia brochopaga]|nr:hypothetical protein ABW21_db0205361 [Drechslerella brochopaga]